MLQWRLLVIDMVPRIYHKCRGMQNAEVNAWSFSKPQPWARYTMTSSNKNIFRVTGLLWGTDRSPVSSPHKGHWRGALMFSLICAWINGWVNNREAGHLRRRRSHYDASVMANMKRQTWRYVMVTLQCTPPQIYTLFALCSVLLLLNISPIYPYISG